MVLFTVQSAQTSVDAAAATVAGIAIIFSLLFTLVVFVFIILVWLLMFALIILMLIGIVFWALMLIDCWQRDEADFPEKTANEKTNWLMILFILFIVGLPWLGGLIYYQKVRKSSDGGVALLR